MQWKEIITKEYEEVLSFSSHKFDIITIRYNSPEVMSVICFSPDNKRSGYVFFFICRYVARLCDGDTTGGGHHILATTA
jgi:hypothetical protein